MFWEQMQCLNCTDPSTFRHFLIPFSREAVKLARLGRFDDAKSLYFGGAVRRGMAQLLDEDFLSLGDTLMNVDGETALQIYREGFELRPSAELASRVGNAIAVRGDLAQAYPWFVRCVALGSTAAQDHYHAAAVALQSQHDLPAAYRYFVSFMRQPGASLLAALGGLSSVFSSAQQYRTAITLLHACVFLDAEQRGVLAAAGDSLSAQRRLQRRGRALIADIQQTLLQHADDMNAVQFTTLLLSDHEAASRPAGSQADPWDSLVAGQTVCGAAACVASEHNALYLNSLATAYCAAGMLARSEPLWDAVMAEDSVRI